MIASSWHTEIGLPVEVFSGPLVSLKQGFPESRYFVFGWGERAYYMAQHPGLGDLLRAIFPGPAVVLVMPLDEPPSEAFGDRSYVFAVPVSRDGIDRLSGYLWGHLAKDSNGAPHRVAAGPYPGSAFYASTGSYDVAHTCNTWTAEALRVAGLPVSATGVVFAGQVLDQVR